MQKCFNCSEDKLITLAFFSHEKNDGVLICYQCIVSELSSVLCVEPTKQISITIGTQL